MLTLLEYAIYIYREKYFLYIRIISIQNFSQNNQKILLNTSSTLNLKTFKLSSTDSRVYIFCPKVVIPSHFQAWNELNDSCVNFHVQADEKNFTVNTLIFDHQLPSGSLIKNFWETFPPL